MEAPADGPRPASAARIWLRLLAWTVPGITAPAILLGAFLLVYGHPGREPVITVGVWVLVFALVLGCGFFDILLRVGGSIPSREEDPSRRRKAIAGQLGLFVLAQVVVTPALGYATAAACTAALR